MKSRYKRTKHPNIQKSKNINISKEFEEIEEKLGFNIKPWKNEIDLDNREHFTKLESNSYYKESINMLLGLIPQAASSGTLLKTYIVEFPKGLPNGVHLAESSKVIGGNLSSIVNKDNKIIAHATFHSTESLGIALSAFTVMSVLTGQYFLTQINSKLTNINVQLDEIMEFLKGEKNSELLSEIGFVKYAYRNFNSIMMFDNQKIATITSLQASKKIAIKDMEFYMNSLELLKNKELNRYEEICESCEKAFGIARDIEISRNLFIFSSLLEVYYSQNYEPIYIQNLREETSKYIIECDTRLANTYVLLKKKFENYKFGWTELKKDYAKEKNINLLTEKIKPLIKGENSPVLQVFDNALNSINGQKEYILTNNGDVYIKNSG